MGYPMAIALLMHRQKSGLVGAALACRKAHRYATEQKQ